MNVVEILVSTMFLIYLFVYLSLILHGFSRAFLVKMEENVWK